MRGTRGEREEERNRTSNLKYSPTTSVHSYSFVLCGITDITLTEMCHDMVMIQLFTLTIVVCAWSLKG